MIKKILVLGVFSLSVVGCAMFKSSPSESKTEASVTYTKDIQPIMAAKCSPCHFPETGKVDRLHTYAAVRKHIDDIIYRIQLDPDNKRYMPFKQKKDAVSAAEINLFQQWKAEGFAE